MGDAQCAGGGVDDQRVLAPTGPAPGGLDDAIGHQGVALVVPLGVPDRRAAGPRDVLGDPHRLPGPLGEGHDGLGERRPAEIGRSAEDPVDARRVVDRGRALARGAREPTGGGAGNLRQPLGHQVRAHRLAGEAGDRLQQPVTDPVRGAHREPGRGLDRLEVLGGQRGDPLLARGVPPVAEVLHQRARVDADRTGQLAGGVARAGVHRVVPVRVQQPVLDRGAGGLAHHLPAQHDPLARSGGHVVAGAGRFAEAALDTGVRDQLDLGNGLETAQMGLGVPVEDDARREHPVGVDDLLDAPHQLGRLRAPFELQERCDVAARGVLGLEGAVETLDRQLKKSSMNAA